MEALGTSVTFTPETSPARHPAGPWGGWAVAIRSSLCPLQAARGPRKPSAKVGGLAVAIGVGSWKWGGGGRVPLAARSWSLFRHQHGPDHKTRQRPKPVARRQM